jgi:hypothetical protein
MPLVALSARLGNVVVYFVLSRARRLMPPIRTLFSTGYAPCKEIVPLRISLWLVHACYLTCIGFTTQVKIGVLVAGAACGAERQIGSSAVFSFTAGELLVAFGATPLNMRKKKTTRF